MRLTNPDSRSWERRWPNRKKGPYTVALRVGLLDGRPQIISLEVRGFDEIADHDPRTILRDPGLPADPNAVEPITSTAIRLPLGQLLDEYLADWRRRVAKGDKSPFGSPWKVIPELQEARRAMAAGKRSGRRPTYGPDHYRKVAEVYSLALRDGRSPTEAVKKAFVVEKTTAAKWVSRAREMGFLPKTTRGRAAAAEEER